MKIMIDTQHDTYEDIQKVLHILTGIIQRKEGSDSYNQSRNYNQSSSTTDTSNMMSMFDSTPSGSKEIPDTPPDFSSFLNLTNGTKKEEVKGVPKIEVYEY